MNRETIALELTLMAMADNALTVIRPTHSLLEKQEINKAYAKEVYTFFNDVYRHVDITERAKPSPGKIEVPEPMIKFDLYQPQMIDLDVDMNQEAEIMDTEREPKEKIKYKPMKAMSARDILTKTDGKEDINLEDSIIELDTVLDEDIIHLDEEIIAKFNLRSDYK